MSRDDIIIAGAGIAGLTAALSFAAKGFSVRLFERRERLEEVGAGLQLSPNATRILGPLGVLEHLGRSAVRPQAILLKNAADLATLARVPLGRSAETRWRAPYLVAHRADLQRALLECVRRQPAITLETGVQVTDAAFAPEGVTVNLEGAATRRRGSCRLLIGADGVWSRLRQITGADPSRFAGLVAYRSVVPAGQREATIAVSDAVTAFLSPRFHLVAYPIRGGDLINFVAIARAPEIPAGWGARADTAPLFSALEKAAPDLIRLVKSGPTWTAWPIHDMSSEGKWIHPGGLALIGDAAHAMTPEAAQGAAMAIEDAALLAELAACENDTRMLLETFERLRRPRVSRVVRRGRFNRFVWHARGPVALARNLALRLRREDSLAAGLDWLYGEDVLQDIALPQGEGAAR